MLAFQQVLHEAHLVPAEDDLALVLRRVEVDVARYAKVAVVVRVAEHLPHVPDVATGAVALLVGIVLAWRGAGPFVVSGACCASVLAVTLLAQAL